MTTLVTGHGLVGARAAVLLRARDEEVVVYDLAPPPSRSGMVAVTGDLLDLDALVEAVTRYRPQRILHTAGLLTPAGVARPHDTIQVNVLGTANVLEAARRAGVSRVVLTSSVVVYDAAVRTDRVGEDHPAAGATVYAATKRSGELLGAAYGRSCGLSFLVVRFAAVYGPTHRPGGGVSRVIHEALSAAVLERRASLKRRWPGRQELVYVEDAAEALIAAGFAVAPRHSAFNVGSGEPVTVPELAAAIGHAAGDVPVVVVDAGSDANPDVIDAPLDLSRAADELGWHPRHDLRGGLAEYAAWLRTAGRG